MSFIIIKPPYTIINIDSLTDLITTFLAHSPLATR